MCVRSWLNEYSLCCWGILGHVTWRHLNGSTDVKWTSDLTSGCTSQGISSSFISWKMTIIFALLKRRSIDSGCARKYIFDARWEILFEVVHWRIVHWRDGGGTFKWLSFFWTNLGHSEWNKCEKDKNEGTLAEFWKYHYKGIHFLQSVPWPRVTSLLVNLPCLLVVSRQVWFKHLVFPLIKQSTRNNSFSIFLNSR